MRNIAACYSENAIKVTDSYCSKNPSIQNTVICIYKLNLSSNTNIFIKFTWSDSQFFSFSINTELKPNPRILQIKTIKGSKKLEFLGLNVELVWDLTNAVYGLGPEPVSGSDIEVFVNSEVKNLCLVSRTVNFMGEAVYSVKTGFSDRGTDHEILIKCSNEELGVWIDKKNAIEVKRLRWNFRGNQTVFVEGLVVDMMWDVYEWFFNQKSGFGVFMFRPRSGLDSRLWIEEKMNLDGNDNGYCDYKEQDKKKKKKIAFSSLICVCKSPPNFLIH